MLDIKSLRETLGRTYTKPDVKKVAEYERALTGNEVATAYLRINRGLRDETVAHFHLGYCAEYNAISIPIFKNNELVNIKYRLLTPDNTRYIGEANAETWLFNDDGLEEAKISGRVLIVEGEFDAIASWQAGVRNVISPASGKDSYGVWIEKLDKFKRVYIAYDNDVGGRTTAKELAARIGVDKCYDVKYPEGIKDANEYLLARSEDDFRKLLNTSKPYYSYEYKDLGEIIEGLRNKKDDALKIPFIPKVEIEKDWIVIISGRTNVGKTSYVLNIADWLSDKKVPTLIMPFERGIESVGKRFLQVKFDKTIQEFKDATETEWSSIIEKSADSPVYFALPKRDEIISTITKASRLFGTKVVIIDHLDYIVRNSQASKEAEIGRTLQELKRTAEELGVIMIIVTHVRKMDDAGSMLQKKPGIEDLKGSSSLYQDPECVVMLTGDPTNMKVDIVKNKGEMTSQEFSFKAGTGKLLDSWGEFSEPL